MPVGCSLDRAVATWRDDGWGARSFNHFDQRVAVVPLVGDGRAGRNDLEQRGALRDIRLLSAGQDQAQRVQSTESRRTLLQPAQTVPAPSHPI